MKIDPMLTDEIDLSETDFRVLSGHIYSASGICLARDKRLMLANRLRPRIISGEYGSIQEFVDRFRAKPDAEAVADLIDMVATHHTGFYREPSHFEFMTNVALPHLGSIRGAYGRPIRLWSAASSSGEEPYTMAIILAEWASAQGHGSWQIAGSDISRPILAEAKRGIYSESKLASVPAHLKNKYFDRGVGSYVGSYRVCEALREKVSFSRLNLLQPEYDLKELQDIVFCRNVMIYFDQPSREKVVRHISRLLVPNGYLMIGHTESLLGLPHGLSQVGHGVFQKKPMYEATL